MSTHLKTAGLKDVVCMNKISNPFVPMLGCAGFPSPAEALGAASLRIDLAQVLIRRSQETYFLRASGQSMVNMDILTKTF